MNVFVFIFLSTRVMMPIMMGIERLETYDIYKSVLYISDAIMQTVAHHLQKVQGKVLTCFNIWN